MFFLLTNFIIFFCFCFFKLMKFKSYIHNNRYLINTWSFFFVFRYYNHNNIIITQCDIFIFIVFISFYGDSVSSTFVYFPLFFFFFCIEYYKNECINILALFKNYFRIIYTRSLWSDKIFRYFSIFCRWSYA